MSQLKLYRNKYCAFALGTGRDINHSVTWISPIDLDDFEVVPTDIVSSMHLWLANGNRVSDSSGVVFLQKGDPMPVIVFAAHEAFWQLPKYQLKTLADELDVNPATPDLCGL